MKGYSKMKDNNPFAQRSRSKKEFPFLDQDVDLRLARTSSKQNQDYHRQPPRPIFDDDENHHDDDYDGNRKKNDFLSGRLQEKDNDPDGNEITGGILRRNFSVSSATSYHRERGKDQKQQLERQSSTRSIQEAVKRAFSVRRSSSVNYERYCRIHDQPMNIDDHDSDYHNYDHDHHDHFERNNNYDNANNGSIATRCSMMKKEDPVDNGRRHVGSKVVRACRRLFGR